MPETQFTKMLAAKTTPNDTHQCFKTQRASALALFGMLLYRGTGVTHAALEPLLTQCTQPMTTHITNARPL
jgi:hypothetical protein